MLSTNSALSHRKDIDGLRAIAILAVLFYHTGLGVPGGFVGVDVFFVISGFLITSILYKDLGQGQFRFLKFWERRARRILPALIVVVAATLVVGWLVLLPQDYADLGKATVFQSAFLANVYNITTSGYFDTASELKPLLHMWSLAVEEQFYFVIPFLLWLLFRFQKMRSRGVLVAVLALLAAVSFVLSMAGMVWRPISTFYLLPTRAWELLVGSLLAVAPRNSGTSRIADEVGSGLGLVLIAASAFLYSQSTPFPGLAALLPVGGASLLIFFGREGEARTMVGRLLSTKGLVFIGLISYSLYLWHWPVIVFARHLFLGEIDTYGMLGLAALSVVLSVVSWKWVETPFRKRTLAPERGIYLWTGAGLCMLAAAGLVLKMTDGVPARWPAQAVAYDAARKDKSYRLELSLKDAQAGRFYRFGAKDSEAKPAVLVWGDSHAMAVIAAFDRYLESRGLVGVGATHSSTPPVLAWSRDGSGLGAEGPAFSQAVVDYVVKQDIRNIVLVCAWKSYNTPNDVTGFQKALINTVRNLSEQGVRVWVLLDVPRAQSDVPTLLARTIGHPEALAKHLLVPQTSLLFDGLDEQTLAMIESLGARVLNPKGAFLSPAGDHYLIAKDGQALYFDFHHLSTWGALTVMLPFLETAVGDGFTIKSD